MRNLGLYIHIPFCLKKCLYCDFNSFDNKDELKDAYVSALINEIGAFYSSGFKVDTIFFGGGTPTALNMKQLEQIMNAIYKKFNVEINAEISIESNPKTVEDYSPLKEIGFNRLSIGMQSANNNELKMLGRIHTFEDFERSYEKASSIFSNINIDIMFSLPDQTIEKWEYTINKANDLNPTHISCYSLKVEERTPFYKMDLILPDDENDRQMYYMAKEKLKNYKRYEISNFSKPGMECRHNLKYWERLPYIGFGAGAHSNMDEIRYNNIYNLEEYIKSDNKIKEKTILSKNEMISEFMFLGLRLLKGASEEDFYMKFKINIDDVFGEVIDKHLKIGTLKYSNKRYYLSDFGIDVSNRVFSDFIID